VTVMYEDSITRMLLTVAIVNFYLRRIYEYE